MSRKPSDDDLAAMLEAFANVANEGVKIGKPGKRKPLPDVLRMAADRLRTLARLDREAATHVETLICLRTNFTGEPPYVGWKGLGLALKEALDERDALKGEVSP